MDALKRVARTLAQGTAATVIVALILAFVPSVTEAQAVALEAGFFLGFNVLHNALEATGVVPEVLK